MHVVSSNFFQYQSEEFSSQTSIIYSRLSKEYYLQAFWCIPQCTLHGLQSIIPEILTTHCYSPYILTENASSAYTCVAITSVSLTVCDCAFCTGSHTQRWSCNQPFYTVVEHCAPFWGPSDLCCGGSNRPVHWSCMFVVHASRIWTLVQISSICCNNLLLLWSNHLPVRKIYPLASRTATICASVDSPAVTAPPATEDIVITPSELWNYARCVQLLHAVSFNDYYSLCILLCREAHAHTHAHYIRCHSFIMSSCDKSLIHALNTR